MENPFERHDINTSFKNEVEYYNHLMHLYSYNYAKNYSKNKYVLDYGCGIGYGSNIIANDAKFIMAIDLSDEAINYANENYKLPNLKFKSITNFNFKENSEKFDVIISMQVIEHVKNEKEYLKSIRDLLKPGGLFIVSTPDKKYRLFPFIQKPWNIYHIKEYSQKDLHNLLSKYFNEISILNISAKTEFAQLEINRVKKQRILTLPCTLFFYPIFFKSFLLRFQSYLFIKLKLLINFIFQKKVKQNEVSKFNSIYCINDLIIGKNLPLTTDLLAICKK